MERVTVTRALDADPDAVRDLITDVEPFMRAGGFDAVRLDGDRLELENTVGLFEVELVLDVVDDADAVLAYEQRDGIFESMRTGYSVEERGDGATVTATTTFEAVDLPVVGKVLDATVVKRQRRTELEEQFDYLEAQLTG